MSETTWTDDLSVGIDLIDEQHKQLIKHLNSLTQAVEEQQGGREVADTLGFLIDYTDFHFSMEERNMEANNYPGFEAHKTLHNEFKAILNKMETEYVEDGPTPLLAESIDTLLMNWLLKHIRVVDVEFGAFLKNNGISIHEVG